METCNLYMCTVKLFAHICFNYILSLQIKQTFHNNWSLYKRRFVVHKLKTIKTFGEDKTYNHKSRNH